jgi:lipoic acid synthetase
MRDLKSAGVDIVTLGQYLRPTPKHAAVARFVEPAIFAQYELEAYRMGFQFVASGPLVRSSYHAAEGFVGARLRAGKSALPERDDALAVRDAAAESGGETARPMMEANSSSEQLIPTGRLVRGSRVTS